MHCQDNFSSPKPIRAIFWDMDGTLIDSIPPLRILFKQFMAQYGHNVTDRDFDRFNGPALLELMVALKKEYDIPLTIEEMGQLYLDGMRQLEGAGTPFFAGAEETVRVLRQRVETMGIVTASPLERAERLIAPIRDCFDFIVSGDDVPSAKPDPAIYLEALRRAGVNADEAVAIEDAIHGVEAAQRAGIVVVGHASVQNGDLPSDHTQHAELQITHYHQLPHLLDLYLPNGKPPLQECDIIQAGLVETRWVQREPWPKDIQEKMDRLWEEAVSEPGNLLYDGVSLTVTGFENGVLTTSPIPFRAQYVQNHGLDIGVRALGICCVVLTKDRNEVHTIVGQRSASVHQYPGCWEFVPGGTFEEGALRADGSVDVQEMILTELHEELGISKESVRDIVTLGLVYDRHFRVYDLCYAIEVTCTSQEIDQTFQPNRECRRIESLPLGRVSEFIQSSRIPTVPNVPAILTLLNSLPYTGR